MWIHTFGQYHADVSSRCAPGGVCWRLLPPPPSPFACASAHSAAFLAGGFCWVITATLLRWGVSRLPVPPFSCSRTFHQPPSTDSTLQWEWQCRHFLITPMTEQCGLVVWCITMHTKANAACIELLVHPPANDDISAADSLLYFRGHAAVKLACDAKLRQNLRHTGSSCHHNQGTADGLAILNRLANLVAFVTH